MKGTFQPQEMPPLILPPAPGRSPAHIRVWGPHLLAGRGG